MLAKAQIGLLQKRINGTLQKYLDMDGAEDIYINTPREVFVRFSNGKQERFEDASLDMTTLRDLVNNIATRNGQDYNPNDDTLSSKLPGGERIEVIQGAAVGAGICLTIRKRRYGAYSLKDFGFGEDDTKKITDLVAARKTILISGGTASGKTTLLELLVNLIPQERRIISIEDPKELHYTHPNSVALEVTASGKIERRGQSNKIAGTVKRQAPDVIIVGEIREEVFAELFYDMANTGHEGSMSTIHANNPELARTKLIEMILVAKGSSLEARPFVQSIVANTLHAIIQVSRTKGGRHGELRVF